MSFSLTPSIPELSLSCRPPALTAAFNPFSKLPYLIILFYESEPDPNPPTGIVSFRLYLIGSLSFFIVFEL